MNPTKLSEMMRLQCELNTRIDPNWVAAKYPWHRAVMMEATELLDHVGWKWWKNEKGCDIAQVQLELVDIWHFIMSMFISLNEGSVELATKQLHEYMTTLPYSIDSTLDKRDVIDSVIVSAGAGMHNGPAFLWLMSHFGLTWDQLHTMYVAKNVLNMFRQDHGYKEGVYVKDWLGQEDNEVLAYLMAQMPNASASTLYAMLTARYDPVLRQSSYAPLPQLELI